MDHLKIFLSPSLKTLFNNSRSGHAILATHVVDKNHVLRSDDIMFNGMDGNVVNSFLKAGLSMLYLIK